MTRSIVTTHSAPARHAPDGVSKRLAAVVASAIGELVRVLARQHESLPRPNGAPAPRLGELLLQEGLISASDLQAALEIKHGANHRKLGEILLKMGCVDARSLQIALAYHHNLPFVNLREFDIDVRALPLLPRDIAARYQVIPLMVYRNRLVLAVEDPSNTEALDAVRFITGLTLELALATRGDIDWTINRYYEVEEERSAVAELGIVSPAMSSLAQDVREVERLGREKPVVRLVNNFLVEAIRLFASDVHLRPHDDFVDLLYRIDGTLIKIRSFSKALLPAVVSRIKIVGRMDIAERRLPQDGRATITDRDSTVDLRISVIPTVVGESVVIRLLNTQAGLKSLSQIGFAQRDHDAFRDMLAKSYGLVLVTGPTGSGKSTTLYAALQAVRERNLNIITVEEPVEYHIDGIEQIEVNTAFGYTFARALRHILRHDPDVIMVGEIRDHETGKIAVESALTGHLVLSTLHTNNAASAINRLAEMGVENYLIASTVTGVLAQRLVRCNCPSCAQEETVDPLVRGVLGVNDDEVFFKGAGCDLCNHTGYRGRMAVYELISVTPEVRDLIARGGSVAELHQLAVDQGMTPLTRHALAVARQRRTSLEEAYRVRLD